MVYAIREVWVVFFFSCNHSFCFFCFYFRLSWDHKLFFNLVALCPLSMYILMMISILLLSLLSYRYNGHGIIHPKVGNDWTRMLATLGFLLSQMVFCKHMSKVCWWWSIQTKLVDDMYIEMSLWISLGDNFMHDRSVSSLERVSLMRLLVTSLGTDGKSAVASNDTIRSLGLNAIPLILSLFLESV